MAMKTKAIGYVRVSTDKQAEHGVSLEAQVEKIRAMAAVHDVELLDVLVDAGESALDVVPGFQGFVLLMIGSRLGLRAGGGTGKTSFSAPAALAPAQHRRQQNAPGKGHAQQRHWVRLKMLLPIGDRPNLLLQLMQVGAKVCAGVLDVSFYLACCLAHSTFSFIISTVRSGVGWICLNRLMPAVSITLATTANAAPTISAAIQLGMTRPSI